MRKIKVLNFKDQLNENQILREEVNILIRALELACDDDVCDFPENYIQAAKSELNIKTTDKQNPIDINITFLEAEREKIYKQAEANFIANNMDGGTSCRMCQNVTRKETAKEILQKIHKAVYEYFPIPMRGDGKSIEHLCQNIACRIIDRIVSNIAKEY